MATPSGNHRGIASRFTDARTSAWRNWLRAVLQEAGATEQPNTQEPEEQPGRER